MEQINSTFHWIYWGHLSGSLMYYYSFDFVVEYSHGSGTHWLTTDGAVVLTPRVSDYCSLSNVTCLLVVYCEILEKSRVHDSRWYRIGSVLDNIQTCYDRYFIGSGKSWWWRPTRQPETLWTFISKTNKGPGSSPLRSLDQTLPVDSKQTPLTSFSDIVTALCSSIVYGSGFPR